VCPAMPLRDPLWTGLLARGRPVGSWLIELGRELLPRVGPAGPLDHGGDRGPGVVLGGVVVRPDVGVPVALAGLYAPDLAALSQMSRRVFRLSSPFHQRPRSSMIYMVRVFEDCQAVGRYAEGRSP
jgi:hypothetical protein